MGRALDNAMLNVGMKDVANGMYFALSTGMLLTESQMVSQISVSIWKISLDRRSAILCLQHTSPARSYLCRERTHVSQSTRDQYTDDENCSATQPSATVASDV